MQLGALGVIVLTQSDPPMPPWIGFFGLGVAVAAFVCSVPALVMISRSQVEGPLRYLVMAVHVLWFVIGGLFLMVILLVKVVFPLL